jgi:hypothetical protein
MRAKVAASMVAKAGFLKVYEEKVSVLDAVERRYSNDASSLVAEQLSKARNSLGFANILRAKEFWKDKTLRDKLLRSAIVTLDRAASLRSKSANKDDLSVSIFGNLGYALFLLSRVNEAALWTSRCLNQGGNEALEGQRGDAKLFRVEPQDTRYEAMLNKLWGK